PRSETGISTSSFLFCPLCPISLSLQLLMIDIILFRRTPQQSQPRSRPRPPIRQNLTYQQKIQVLDFCLRSAKYLLVVIWDFDSQDSIGATAKQSKSHYGNILDQRPDQILTLNHETIETTVHDVIPDALKKIKDKKYKMVTVAQCLGMEPYQAITSPSSRDGSWAC
ncbi:hypothetical protein RSAG8_12033, partial [Rhizoctonia solani AG-8 WAC10335]